MRYPQSAEWFAGMQLEVNAMFAKGVFEMIDEKVMSTSANLLGIMWRYRAKPNPDVYVHTFRARLVERGDSQVFGVDYDITLSSVAKMVTFRVVLAVAVKLGLILYQGDIDTAKGLAEDQALYGLHQSGAEWFEEVDSFLKSQGFYSKETEPCLYARYQDSTFSLIPPYVDDVLLATNSVNYKTSLFAAFVKKYDFKDGGIIHKFLGIHQEKYCKEVLDRFGLGAAHGSATPMETNAKFKSKHNIEAEDVPSFDYRAAIE
ncbi:hypothetical protein PHMEG_00023015 [Phytophthora megakarya]|uniref:Reverse transcriptase Ty1/copia-type domain-containing protein n=1 Tax=Phytophthora megakarya TaxID=4795 RepID=A0A225VI29_9STRA|nr:hypothetical protein PHMEG_00023015 [Phytophthora megakarya]